VKRDNHCLLLSGQHEGTLPYQRRDSLSPLSSTRPGLISNKQKHKNTKKHRIRETTKKGNTAFAKQQNKGEPHSRTIKDDTRIPMDAFENIPAKKKSHTAFEKQPKKEMPHSRNILSDTRIQVDALEKPKHYSNHNSLCSEIIDSARILVLLEMGKARELADKGTGVMKLYRLRLFYVND
jgi:hypothetical protein